MKDKTITPTGVERFMREGEYIISSTDLEGRITVANPVLVDFSGYSEEELLGTQHNIVRHPDMPRSVFALAWDTIRDGDDFSGYLVNLCRDGRHYWVFAHIRPILDEDGNITGYRSVRRSPRREAVARIQPLYAEILAAEKAAGPRNAIEAGTAVLSAKLAAERLSYKSFIASL